MRRLRLLLASCRSLSLCDGIAAVATDAARVLRDGGAAAEARRRAGSRTPPARR